MPLDQSVQSVDILEKSKILGKRNNLLSKVKHYIDEILDPVKAYYVDSLTVNEALKFLNIAEVDYYNVLSVSPTSGYEIHLRRPPNSVILKAWRANMDLKRVFNYYKAVSYMSAYFSKSE